MSSSERPDGAGGERSTWSIASRLTLWYASSAFVMVVVATGVLYWVLVGNIDREDDQFLIDTVQILRGLMRERPADLDVLRQEAEWEGATRRFARLFIRILDTRGSVIVETPGSQAIFEGREPVVAPPDVEPSAGTDYRLASGTLYRVLAAESAVGTDGHERRIIQVALDHTSKENMVRSYRQRLWGVLAVAFLAAGAIGYTIARRGLQPLTTIAAKADGIRSSTLDARIPTEGLPAELSSLAVTFNQMLNRLEEAFARLSSFSADLAHELRTPVNNLRGELEVALGRPRDAEAYRRRLESALEESVRVSDMIDGLLLIARADRPEAHLVRTAVDVYETLNSVRELYEPAAAEGGVHLDLVGAVEGLTARLDRTLFQRAISNLVANAVAHTPRGGCVRLSASAMADGSVQVEVRDTGAGIPAEHLARVGERFYRIAPYGADGSAGLGLGLAIVKSIARIHGGRIDIESAVNQGTRVSMVFPGRGMPESAPGDGADAMAMPAAEPRAVPGG